MSEITKRLPVYIDDFDLKEIQTEAVDVLRKVEELREQKKKISTQLKDQELLMNELYTALATRERMEDVECFVNFNWEDNTKTIIRHDTHEIVTEEVITDYDRQQQLL